MGNACNRSGGLSREASQPSGWLALPTLPAVPDVPVVLVLVCWFRWRCARYDLAITVLMRSHP